MEERQKAGETEHLDILKLHMDLISLSWVNLGTLFKFSELFSPILY